MEPGDLVLRGGRVFDQAAARPVDQVGDVRIAHGRIVEIGPPQQVLGSPREARTRDQQEAAMAAPRFKTDVLWAQLDALHFAYVQPGFIPPGAFVPDDRR